jgi:hypothetical protein
MYDIWSLHDEFQRCYDCKVNSFMRRIYNMYICTLKSMSSAYAERYEKRDQICKMFENLKPWYSFWLSWHRSGCSPRYRGQAVTAVWGLVGGDTGLSAYKFDEYLSNNLTLIDWGAVRYLAVRSWRCGWPNFYSVCCWLPSCDSISSCIYSTIKAGAVGLFSS